MVPEIPNSSFRNSSSGFKAVDGKIMADIKKAYNWISKLLLYFFLEKLPVTIIKKYKLNMCVGGEGGGGIG